METLKYKDETDRCYGVAGMTLAAFILDYEKYISSISIERPDIESIEFSHEFYTFTPENISAKAAWAHTLEQYQMVLSMLISNVMCRSMVKEQKEVSYAVNRSILPLLHDYTEECQIDDDEAQQLFDKHFDYLNRAYHNSRLHAVARRLADELSSRRQLLHSDLTDLLSQY